MIVSGASRRTVVLALALSAGILFSASAAQAQSSVDQYIPALDRGGSTESEQDPTGSPPLIMPTRSEGAERPITAAEIPAGTSRGGTAPATDYPMTPLVAVVAALVVAGILLRLIMPAVRALLGPGRRS